MQPHRFTYSRKVRPSQRAGRPRPCQRPVPNERDSFPSVAHGRLASLCSRDHRMATQYKFWRALQHSITAERTRLSMRQELRRNPVMDLRPEAMRPEFREMNQARFTCTECRRSFRCGWNVGVMVECPFCNAIFDTQPDTN